MDKIKKFFTVLWGKIRSFFKKVGKVLSPVLVPVGKFFKKIGGLLSKFFGRSTLLNSLISIILALFIGYLIMLIVDPNQAWNGLIALVKAGITERNQARVLGNILFDAAPMIVMGLAVGFSFKTGLFNIGGSGQFMMAGWASLATVNVLFNAIEAGTLSLPGYMPWVLGVLAGMLMGALWAAIPGALKAFFNVSEVLSSIMMNYIGMYLSVTLATIPAIFNESRNQINNGFPLTGHTPVWFFGDLFERSYLDISILIAILAAIIVAIILKKTTLGYTVRAVGHNPDGSRCVGINYKKSVIISMAISGTLAGLSAALSFLAVHPSEFHVEEIIRSAGFEGISVALIAQSDPLGTIFSGFLLSYLRQSRSAVQLASYNTEIINIVVSVIIYFIAISGFVGYVLAASRDKRRARMELKKGGEHNV
jgi:simple sugar transport system permease protein